jgi:hypothetical protein
MRWSVWAGGASSSDSVSIGAEELEELQGEGVRRRGAVPAGSCGGGASGVGEVGAAAGKVAVAGGALMTTGGS